MLHDDVNTTIWKYVEKSAPYKRGKLILRRLAGQELWLQPTTTARTRLAGGWLYQPDGLDGNSIVYSLGVGDDITFDLALIREFGLHVHAFDPIPSVASWLAKKHDVPEQFHFHPWAAADDDTVLKLYPRVRNGDVRAGCMYTTVKEDGCAEQGIEVPAYSLATISTMLAHRHIHLLKLDIEGAEYEVLDSMLRSALRPTQLLVEFHHRFTGVGLEETVTMVDRLVADGYELLAVSDSGREYLFVRRRRLEKLPGQARAGGLPAPLNHRPNA